MDFLQESILWPMVSRGGVREIAHRGRLLPQQVGGFSPDMEPSPNPMLWNPPARGLMFVFDRIQSTMYQVETTKDFDAWLDGIKDSLTRKRLGMRLRKAQLGNLGDVKPVGEGVWEMREFFGPGWRMYYIQQGSVLIVMLGGGDKSTQAVDIVASVELARLFKE